MSRVVLVTGGNRGIGLATARELAERGYTVVVTHRSGEPPEGLHGVQCDVTSSADVDRAFSEIEAHQGPVEVLVSNAGITRDGLLMRMKTADWQSVLDLNLTGVFLCTRAVSKAMLKARSGRIINITSVVALMGNAGQANYSAAKAGLLGLTRSNAAEFASRGVTVNAVAPGFIESDMTADLDKEPILKAIPLGRMGRAAEVAGAVRFLAADPAAAYITGQVLQVDGGMVMR